MNFNSSIIVPLNTSNNRFRLYEDLTTDEQVKRIQDNKDFLCEYLHTKADEHGVVLDKVFITSSSVTDYEGKSATFTFNARLDARYKVGDKEVVDLWSKMSKVLCKAGISNGKNYDRTITHVLITMHNIHRCDLENKNFENILKSYESIEKFKL